VLNETPAAGSWMVCDELEGASEGCALRPVNASQTPIVMDLSVCWCWRKAAKKESEEDDREVARFRWSSVVMMEWRSRDSQLFHVQRRKPAERLRNTAFGLGYRGVRDKFRVTDRRYTNTEHLWQWQ
jgi:hypothetical protein